jgi:hypothetical protein
MAFWHEGDLPPIILSTGLGASDVWAVALAQANAAGSMGELVQMIQKMVDDNTALIVAR